MLGTDLGLRGLEPDPHAQAIDYPEVIPGLAPGPDRVVGVWSEAGVFTPETLGRIARLTDRILRLPGVVARDVIAPPDRQRMVRRTDDPMAAIESRRTDDPSPSVEHADAGLRLFRNLLRWGVSLYTYRGFFHAPAGEVESGPRLRLFFPPLNVYGASAQGATLGGVLSFETGYYDSRSERSGRNPAVENSSVRLLAGYQREVRPDFTVAGQYSVQVMEDHEAYVATRGPGMPKRPAVRHVLTARLTRLFLHQTLKLGLFALASPNEGDWYAGPEARYHVTDALSFILGLNVFRGPRRSEFGQFEGNSNVFAVVRYTF
ncbi:MAG: hypothetical protein HY294_08775 [Candidatus Rokubacteria bacterium]|nr:hypothetical protein [Candidatus Rokubacteria bacterium]MBI3826077.1 hypothetical protein [Candidatus Rokubacteria bacterium]